MRKLVGAIGVAALLLGGAGEHTKAQEQNLQYEVEQLKRQIKAQEEETKALKKKVDELATKPFSPSDFKVYWKEGLRLDSGDGNFKLALGGRVMTDISWVSEDSSLKQLCAPGNTTSRIGDSNGGVELRRARMYMSGSIYSNTEYKLEVDFEPGNAANLTDAYVAVKLSPVGKFTIGQSYEPFGLETQTSSRYVTFIERSLPTEGFGPSRSPGVKLTNHVLDDRLTYGVGAFRKVQRGDGGWAGTARITGLPYYADKGRQLLHLGLAYSYRSIRDTDTDSRNELQLRTRPENHNVSRRWADTGEIEANSEQRIGIEAAMVLGPFSVQTEYMRSGVDRPQRSGSDVHFSGYYVQASYFLTGEHRNYRKADAVFDRVKPNNNFNLAKGGWGAWEVAARYSTIDLDDENIQGNQIKNWTAGLNWHLNPNVRLMANYIRSRVIASSPGQKNGEADMAILRVQVDF